MTVDASAPGAPTGAAAPGADLPEPTGSSTSALRRWATHPVGVVVALLLVLVAPFVQELTAQGAPRVAMTGAIVDDRSLVIDGYLLGVDFTTHGGRTYSDKAPGQSLLAVPAYAAARAMGAEPARVHRVEENLTLWAVTLTAGILPLAAGVGLMAGAIRRRGLDPSIPVLAGIVFGTMLLPLASNLYGHVLAGILGYASWCVLDRAGSRARVVTGVAAGLLGGAAVAVEYQAALVVGVVGVWLLARRRWRPLAGFILGGLPVAAALMAYQRAVTGSPVSSGYHSKEWEGESGFFATHVTHPPSPAQLLEILVGSRGLLVFTPVVLLAAVGLVQRWRSRRDDGALVALAVLVGFLLLQASWANTWGGEGPGPRYVAPALPFLAVGLAHVWPSTPGPLRRVALAVSILTMGLATTTSHLTPADGILGVHHLKTLVEKGPEPTLFTMALGPAGWMLHLALAGGLVLLVHGAVRARQQETDRAR